MNSLDDILIPKEKGSMNENRSILTIIGLIIVMIMVIIVLQTNIEEVSKEYALEIEQGSSAVTTSNAVKEIKKELEEELVIKNTLQEDEGLFIDDIDDELILVKEEPIKETYIAKIEKRIVQDNLPTQEIQTFTHKIVPPIEKKKYFVQIGSYSKVPSKRFLSTIKTRGFSYILTSPSHKGIRKLLIGPYHSKSIATTKLHNIKDTLNKSAFIITK